MHVWQIRLSLLVVMSSVFVALGFPTDNEVDTRGVNKRTKRGWIKNTAKLVNKIIVRPSRWFSVRRTKRVLLADAKYLRTDIVIQRIWYKNQVVWKGQETIFG